MGNEHEYVRPTWQNEHGSGNFHFCFTFLFHISVSHCWWSVKCEMNMEYATSPSGEQWSQFIGWFHLCGTPEEMDGLPYTTGASWVNIRITMPGTPQFAIQWAKTLKYAFCKAFYDLQMATRKLKNGTKTLVCVVSITSFIGRFDCMAGITCRMYLTSPSDMEKLRGMQKYQSILKI